MRFIKFLKNIFSGKNTSRIITLYLKDNKCGNKIKIILRKGYDIVKVYDDKEEAAFSLKKVVICDHCYNKVYVNLKFNNYYDIIAKDIENGELITEEEFYSDS